MKINARATLILTLISILTISVLTLLMHFRYHITRLNLVNEHLNVTLYGITRTINNSLKLGIKLEFLKNVNTLIQRAKKQEHIIESIDVLTINNGSLNTLYKTNTEPLDNNTLLQIMQKVKSSKGVDWSLTLENGLSYVGVTLRNPAGLDHSVIVASYKNSVITSQEHDEVVSLYKRMAAALLATIIFSFLISFRSTKSLTKMIEVLRNSLEKLETGDTQFDLNNIHDPILRANFRSYITSFLKARKILTEIDLLLIAAESETKSKDNKNDKYT